MLKRIIRDYFYFSKRERNALIVLLLITGAFYAWPYFYEVKRDPPLTDVELLAIAKELQEENHSNTNHTSANFSNNIPAATVPPQLFAFDPNTLDEAGFVRLGLPPRTARTIINYRSKGGRFRKPDDLRKIYTLRPEDAERLVPYVRIAGMQQESSGYIAQRSEVKPLTRIDINAADAATLEQLPGIGKVLSERIVRYREALGGFYSVQQLKEVSGISEDLFEQIRAQLVLKPGTHQRWSLTQLNRETLSQHPYCSKATADAIIRFRHSKGVIQSVDELKSIPDIRPEIIARLLPYLKTDTD